MSLARYAFRGQRSITHQNSFLRHTRAYSTSPPPPPPPKQPSRHASFYSDMVPGMLSVGLLGSAVYLGLRFLQADLSHERYLDEARTRVRELEKEIETLRMQQLTETAIDAAAPKPPEMKKRGWFW